MAIIVAIFLCPVLERSDESVWASSLNPSSSGTPSSSLAVVISSGTSSSNSDVSSSTFMIGWPAYRNAVVEARNRIVNPDKLSQVTLCSPPASNSDEQGHRLLPHYPCPSSETDLEGTNQPENGELGTQNNFPLMAIRCLRPRYSNFKIGLIK